MAQTIEARYQALRDVLESIGQEQVFAFWGVLDADRRRQLLDDLSSVDLTALPELARLAASRQAEQAPPLSLQPAIVMARASVPGEVVLQGRELLREGKVAAFAVAGGQGTRLGFDGPKGAFPISPVRNKSLFQLLAESIIATDRRYGCAIQWYIMTSPANHEATQAFFLEHAHFGMRPDRVTFFQQGVMPAFDLAGRLLLQQKHRLALSPDGHGGSLLAMARTGVLADMARRGIEYISYFQVDNPLVMCLDPVFLGAHAAHASEMSSKAVSKADDLEKVGNFVTAGDRLTVIEYSDLPEALARARNANGGRRFDAGNIAIHVLSRSFVERLTAKPAIFALPWHQARKKVRCVDLSSGRGVQPQEPNAVKLESFVFDALPLARNPVVLATSRAEEFSPVKNAAGVDSVETARRDMNRRAARWMEATGFRIPWTASGDPEALLEISPLLALDQAQFVERGLRPTPIAPGAAVYLE
jgi:UDP-N-acetylglucosamine/UDP-N-acetylgalactosamine diphosphorylase